MGCSNLGLRLGDGTGRGTERREGARTRDPGRREVAAPQVPEAEAVEAVAVEAKGLGGVADADDAHPRVARLGVALGGGSLEVRGHGEDVEAGRGEEHGLRVQDVDDEGRPPASTPARRTGDPDVQRRRVAGQVDDEAAPAASPAPGDGLEAPPAAAARRVRRGGGRDDAAGDRRPRARRRGPEREPCHACRRGLPHSGQPLQFKGKPFRPDDFET